MSLKKCKTNVSVLFFSLVLIISSCTIQQTDEGEMPEVEVETKDGELPEYDVDWVNVKTGTRTRTVKVPRIIVTMEETEVEVPYIDFEMPNESNLGETEERTITVEVEVANEEREIDIKKIYAKKNELIVISELEETGKNIGDERIRVSDRVIINAPEDLRIKHYIIGSKPDGDFNSQYKFYNRRNEVEGKLANATIIYEN